MDNLVKKETLTIGPPARCTGQDITLPGHKEHCYYPWKYIPAIISDWGSDLVGVRIPQTQGA